VSGRKLRLFACGCVRQAENRLLVVHLPESGCHTALNVAERYADGLTTARWLEEAREDARLVHARFHTLARRSLEEARGKRRHFVKAAYAVSGWAWAAEMAAWVDPHVYPYPWETDCGGGEYDISDIGLHRAAYDRVFSERGDILRDIINNPFRPVSVDPVWRTSDVVALAAGIYEERAFDRLPILADALQDAGCDDADILGHCRGDSPHLRGCWAVDLVLGKT
jgi:hypothetical protein